MFIVQFIKHYKLLCFDIESYEFANSVKGIESAEVEYTGSTFTLRALISFNRSRMKHINSLQCLCECAILRRPVFSR